MNVEMLPDLLVRDLMVVAEKPSDLVGCFVGLADDVNLGTIAGREDDQLPSDTAPCQFCQGGFEPLRAKSTDSLNSTGAVR